MLNGMADFRKELAVSTIDRQMMSNAVTPYMAEKDMLRRNSPVINQAMRLA